MACAVDGLAPIHPGELLADDLDALEISARKFAEHIGVPPNRITGIIAGDRSITADTAIRLGLAFGTTPQYWMNLQQIYELKIAKAALPKEVLTIKPVVEHTA